MKTIEMNGKQYRVHPNGLVHVLEGNRTGFDWRVLNSATRGVEYRQVIRLSK